MVSHRVLLAAVAGALIAAVCMMAPVVSASHDFDAYRLAHYDTSVFVKAEEPELDMDDEEDSSSSSSSSSSTPSSSIDSMQQIGSRIAAVHLMAAAAPAEDDALTDRANLLNRKVAIIKVANLTPDRVDSLVANRKLGALLVLLPSLDHLSQLSEEDVAAWRTLEQHLVSKSWSLPVYFAHSTPYLESVYDSLYNPSQASNLYNLAIGSGVPAPVKKVTLQNLASLITGTLADSRGASAPVVGVVAHYDTFTAAPSMPSFNAAAASGPVAVLELARMFARLYADANSRGSVNMLFLLTAAGGANYNGAEEWLKSADPALLKAFRFVLCLDNLSPASQGPVTDGARTLYIHSSKPPTSPALADILSAFHSVAPRFNTRVQSVHKKVVVSDPELAWEHERFAMNRVVTLTASYYASHTDASRRSMVSTPHDADLATASDGVSTSIQMIAEVLGAYVFQLNGTAADGHSVEVFGGDLSVNPVAVRSWIHALATSNRFTGSLEPANTVVQGLHAQLTSAGGEFSHHTFTLDSSAYRFYTGMSAKASAFLVKPAIFEVLITLGILGYMACIFVGLTGRESISIVKELFTAAKPKRK